MSKLSTIVVYSLVMALSSYIAGLLPLSVNFSQSVLHTLSVFSVGLLISTGLVIIIPEGLERYTVSEPIGLWLLFGFVTLFTIDRLTSILSPVPHNHHRVNKDKKSLELSSASAIKMQDFGNSSPGSSAGSNSLAQDEEEYIDPLAALMSKSLPHTEEPRYIIPATASRLTMLKSIFQNTTTLGLVIHSFTDGLALAASIMATSSDDDTSVTLQSTMIVIAIFMHKLPASFALTTTLLDSQLQSRREIMYHLIAFSLSAPISALLTYTIITKILSVSLVSLSGELLIFSAGSFLYVGFHSLHEMFNSQTNKPKTSGLQDYFVCLLGMIVPTLITLFKEDVE